MRPKLRRLHNKFMSVINASELIFTPDDALNWSLFLNTPTGQRLIPKAAEMAPRLLSKGDTNELLINHGAVLGFSSAVQAMLDLAVPQKEEQPIQSNFPPLPPE